MHDHRDDLGIDKIVVSGESGGGILTLATTLKAGRDGKLELIDGVYAHTYFIDIAMAGVKLYDPDVAHTANPLAWPLHAGADDLAAMPPHVISVNQLEPLRDEGLAHYRKLADARVSVASRTVNGTCHAGDCLLRVAMPEVHLATIRDIKTFADSP
jgi:acetyl esterase/lipase